MSTMMVSFLLALFMSQVQSTTAFSTTGDLTRSRRRTICAPVCVIQNRPLTKYSPVQDYYDILEVAEDAEEGEIKSSFRRLIKIYHPDRCKDEDAAMVSERLNEAYAALKDTDLRLQYDTYGLNGMPSGAEEEDDLKNDPLNREGKRAKYGKKKDKGTGPSTVQKKASGFGAKPKRR